MYSLFFLGSSNLCQNCKFQVTELYMIHTNMVRCMTDLYIEHSIAYKEQPATNYNSQGGKNYHRELFILLILIQPLSFSFSVYSLYLSAFSFVILGFGFHPELSQQQSTVSMTVAYLPQSKFIIMSLNCDKGRFVVISRLQVK